MTRHRIPTMVLAMLVLSGLTTSADEVTQSAGWESREPQTSLPAGLYMCLPEINFSQAVMLRPDGTFEAEFSGEVHEKHRGSRWATWKIHGRWAAAQGVVTFRYEDHGVARTDSFEIGTYRSRPAFRFTRPADGHCAFIAECFVLEEQKRSNQPPQHNAGSRPSSGDSPASETPSSLGPRG